MDEVGVTLLLREHGIPLAQAYEATNSILRDEPTCVQFPDEADVEAVRRKLQEFGAIV